MRCDGAKALGAAAPRLACLPTERQRRQTASTCDSSLYSSSPKMRASTSACRTGSRLGQHVSVGGIAGPGAVSGGGEAEGTAAAGRQGSKRWVGAQACVTGRAQARWHDKQPIQPPSRAEEPRDGGA